MSRKKILVPVDLEIDSSGVLRFAENIAKNIYGRISCVNIMPIQEYSTDINKNMEKRRSIEMRLAETATGSFSGNKPEFDIIVTRGNFEARLISMVEELDIDLVIMQTHNPTLIKQLHSVLCVPIVIFDGNSDCLKQLVLQINLDEKYYYKIQNCIDIATLLNTQIKVLAQIPAKNLESKYKETLDDIKLMIEKENIASTTSFFNEVDESIKYSTYEATKSESLLLSIEEYLMPENRNQEEKPSSVITIIPNRKKQVKYIHSIKEHILN